MKEVFTYNPESDQIELESTGQVVAKRDPNLSNMFNPYVDSQVDPETALHVLKGLTREHDIRFGPGDEAAELLSTMDFSKPLVQEFFHDAHSLVFSEYTNTIRVKETNVMMMRKLTDTSEWVFDIGGEIPEPLLNEAFLRFYANPANKIASGEYLLAQIKDSHEEDYAPMSP
jgi:hypothetical protein